MDGTLVRTDRSKTAGPTKVNGQTVDLWWSGKHHHHGGNVQVVTAPGAAPGQPVSVADRRRIGAVTASALVLFHTEHGRTT